MKILFALATATVLGFCAPSAVLADSCYRHVVECKPVKVRTCEICRHAECRWAKDSCGNRYSFMVTIITYRDEYSDGSYYTYTRTYSA